MLAAALTVAADLVLTGALHLDGLADTADGLLPHLDRSRRLAVMAAPDVGAFAVAAVVVTLLLRTTALATADVEGWRWVVLLAGVWCLARAGMAAIVTTVPYARQEGGLATAFAGGSPLVAVPSALIGVVAVVVGGGWGGLAGVGRRGGRRRGGGRAGLAAAGRVHRRRGRRRRHGPRDRGPASSWRPAGEARPEALAGGPLGFDRGRAGPGAGAARASRPLPPGGVVRRGP